VTSQINLILIRKGKREKNTRKIYIHNIDIIRGWKKREHNLIRRNLSHESGEEDEGKVVDEDPHTLLLSSNESIIKYTYIYEIVFLVNQQKQK
jgi:hypothetical protein